jgi:hypothetical protein
MNKKLFTFLCIACFYLGASVSAFAENVPINITFDDAGCPLSVDNEPDLLKADRLVWQAVDQSGNATGENYSLYFEPFGNQATLFTVNGRGKIRSPKIDRNAPKGPEVEYKYTVVGHACPDYPLDPRFSVRR